MPDCYISLYDLLVVVCIGAAWALVLVLVKNAYRPPPAPVHYSNDYIWQQHPPPRSTYSPTRSIHGR